VILLQGAVDLTDPPRLRETRHGATSLSKCCTRVPSALTRYFLKFQLGSVVRQPSSWKTGLAPFPVTNDGASMVKVTP
jgi:hypothetical protein